MSRYESAGAGIDVQLLQSERQKQQNVYLIFENQTKNRKIILLPTSGISEKLGWLVRKLYNL